MQRDQSERKFGAVKMSRGKAGRWWPAEMLLAAVVTTVGCNSQGSAAVDGQQVAQEALATVLDTWKTGGAAEALREQEPQIVVGDLDWQAGRRLVDYRLADAGAFDGKHLRMPVTLIVQPPTGVHKRRIDTSYIVGIDPVITVIRESE